MPNCISPAPSRQKNVRYPKYSGLFWGDRRAINERLTNPVTFVQNLRGAKDSIVFWLGSTPAKETNGFFETARNELRQRRLDPDNWRVVPDFRITPNKQNFLSLHKPN
jgi:hypothetical protein